MHSYNSKSMEIEHLLVGISCCINDLHGYQQYMNIYDINQAELQLNKLDALITNLRKRPDPPQTCRGLS